MRMEEIKESNAIIERSEITTQDHGILTVWLHLKYAAGGQGFGGYALYLPGSFKLHRVDPGFAGHFIFRCMEIAGVESWDRIKGKTIRVKASHDKVVAIGHIVNEDWFCPADDFRQKE